MSQEGMYTDGPYCEWPPQPPIGQLKSEMLQGSKEELLTRRFGLRVSDVFKKIPHSQKHWDKERYLQLALFYLDGKSSEDTALSFDSVSRGEMPISSDTARVLFRKYATPFAQAIARITRVKAVGIHALLSPPDPEAESKLARIEACLGLPRSEIFSFKMKAQAHRYAHDSLYEVKNIIGMLYAVVCEGSTNKAAAEKYQNCFSRPRKRGYRSGKNADVVFSRMLSSKAKSKLRELRGFARPCVEKGSPFH